MMSGYTNELKRFAGDAAKQKAISFSKQVAGSAVGFNGENKLKGINDCFVVFADVTDVPNDHELVFFNNDEKAISDYAIFYAAENKNGIASYSLVRKYQDGTATTSLDDGKEVAVDPTTKLFATKEEAVKEAKARWVCR